MTPDQADKGLAFEGLFNKWPSDLRGLSAVTPAVTGYDDDDDESIIDGSSDSTTLPCRWRPESRGCQRESLVVVSTGALLHP